MTKLAIILTAILAVVLYGVLEQHSAVEQQEREQAERVLDACWQNAAANGGTGAAVCEALAESLAQ